MKKLITCFVCFLFPVRLSFWFLNLLGHKVSSSARIGFALVWITGKINLEEKSRIGHFNIIRINSLSIARGGYIGKFNRISGPVEIVLHETAAIGNGNSIDRAPIGVTYGQSVLQLGILSKLTANHRIDCTRSVILGDYTTVAGHDSQLWTHGYYHDKTGPGRFRIDGEIIIGNNVYIGSRSVINAGVKIADAVVVGSNSVVSKSLDKSGIYVSQALRYIEPQADDVRLKYKKLEGYDVCEEVYEYKKQ